MVLVPRSINGAKVNIARLFPMIQQVSSAFVSAFAKFADCTDDFTSRYVP